MSNYNKAINSDSYALLKSFVSDSNPIVAIEVIGKWLTATLSNNIRFSVLN